jgi:hypothetical protein
VVLPVGGSLPIVVVSLEATPMPLMDPPMT